MKKDWTSALSRLPRHLITWIWSAVFILQMVLAFLVFTEPESRAVSIAGWIIWGLGTGFAIWPILALRRRGHVPRGKSYMETTTLVDTGIYALVRHPQGGTAGILLSLALPLIGQHWLVLVYVDTFNADEACIQKFGQEYVDYMQRVPRVNFLAGALRLLHARGEGTGR
jgi:protein-S-isoprenylcysteine O-methyltransferase Ste14